MGPAAFETLPDEQALWSARSGDGGDAARHGLFLAYIDFAKSMALRQFRSRTRGDLELADLHQMACTGLLEAIDRFDPTLNVPFRSFAARRIAGSIADGIGHMSEVREQHSARARAKRERLRSLASDSAGAQTATAALDTLADIAIGLALGFMLEGTALYVNDAADGTIQLPSAYESAAWQELVGRLQTEIETLPTRERDILREHYHGGIGFDVLADLHRISRGRVSQLHRAALVTLRRKLARHGHFSLQR